MGLNTAAPERFQGGLTNDELREAWNRKLPGVEPTDRELAAFALGVEVGDGPCQVYFRERNSARDAWRSRMKQCEALLDAIKAAGFEVRTAPSGHVFLLNVLPEADERRCGSCLDGYPGGPNRCSECNDYSQWRARR